MTSNEANSVMANVIEENGKTAFKDMSKKLMDECSIAQSTANTYIHDSAEIEVLRRDGVRYVVERKSSLDEIQETVSPTAGLDVEKKEEEEINNEVGGPTGETFHGLSVLEDVGHPDVPEGHQTYIPRRMGERSTELGKNTDLDIVTNTMESDNFGTLLVGKHGVGKDKLILHICEETNRPVIRMVGNDDPDFVSLLVGSYAPNDDGDFEHREGLLTKAIKNGYVFVIDEFNALSGKVQTMLNMILEDSTQSQLTIPETNEVVEPHDEFKFVATQNPNEVGYGGREMLDHATASRFFPVDIPPLPPEGEKRVVASQTDLEVDDNSLDMLLKEKTGIVTSIRNMHDIGNISTWVSTRDVIQIAEMASNLGDVKAATELILTGRAAPEDEEPIRSSIRDQNW